jgi:hypothetical protein
VVKITAHGFLNTGIFGKDGLNGKRLVLRSVAKYMMKIVEPMNFLIV